MVRITFLRAETISYMLYVSSLTGFLIFGQAICLISGNLDLSIARIAGISVLTGALTLTRWLPGTPAIVAIIFVVIFGAFLGFLNGLLVGKVGVNSFLATLSTYLIYLYFAYYLLSAPIGGYELPSTYMWLGAEIGGINISFILFVIIGLFLHFILKRTSFGVNIYATGADAETAKALGIDTGNVVLYTYTIAGALGGVAGHAYAGFTGAVTNSIAMGEVFWTFAGAILSGASLKGGRGSMINVIGGSIFIGLVTTGVLVFDIVATLRMVIAGIIILASILISRAVELWEEKLLKV
jgi:ribose transport system permease protein